MYNERLQILISKEQRRRLEQEARRRSASVASLIREAVDERFGGSNRAAKIAAAESIAIMEPLPHIAPEDLERAIAESYDEETRFPPEGTPR